MPKLTSLTLDAARFMREQGLVIRNTNTEQLSSLHYQGHHKPDWHGVNGIYSVPLWTIAIPGITEAQQIAADIADKVECYKAQQLKQVPRHPSVKTPHPLNSVFIDTLDPEIAFAESATQQVHLDRFLMAIKAFIRPYTAFSSGACGAYNYELLVASLNSNDSLYSLPYLDDLGRYTTGGRCPDRTLHPGNIVYRVTFNAVEIAFFKRISNRDYDTVIFSNEGTPENEYVATTVRYMLCNRLAVEMIANKLVLFLNACGDTRRVICLNHLELTQLWDNVRHAYAADTKEIIRNGWIVPQYFDYFSDKTYPISSHAGAASHSGYLTLNRYKTPIYQKFPNHQHSIDVLRSMYFYLNYVTQTHLPSAISWQMAQPLLEKITHICHQDTFDPKAMRLLVNDYQRFKTTLNTPQPPVLIQSDNSTNRSNQTLSWQVLNGFLIVLGVAAVSFAFAALSLASLSTTGLMVAAIGVLSICVGGYGLFKPVIPPRPEPECKLGKPKFAL